MNGLLKKLFTSRYYFPRHDLLRKTACSFSPAERVIFGIFVVLLIISTAGLLQRINALFLVEVPARGGVLQEGIVGSPRFVNPLLALSDADRDLSMLIYAGLLKATPNGALIPELAERFTVSDDGLIYTFTIRADATFHDGTPVTADDILFTIQMAQDPALKSPKRANWEGVTVEKRGEREISFTLKQPYAPFLENATLGILPRHIWGDADAEQFPFSPYQIEAVGSGPYRVAGIKRGGSGLPILYELVPFEGYALGAPYIDRLIVRFYQNEEGLLAALQRGEIDAVSALTPQGAAGLPNKDRFFIIRTPLPRVFGVFLNQNQAPIFAEKAVREALALAVDKNRLVEETLLGYGVPIDSPVPPRLLDSGILETVDAAARRAEAETLLEKTKWVRNKETGIRERISKKKTERLSFSLVTSNVPELRGSAEILKEMWSEIGIEVRVQVFETGDLNQNVIRPRKYDALLFGEIIGRDLDLFAFWHSSQRNDPGLNIALYANSSVDRLLEKARGTEEIIERLANYRAAIQKINADVPVVFLYSPEFIYVVPQTLQGLTLDHITIPSERFLQVEEWYLKTEKVWKIFAKDR